MVRVASERFGLRDFGVTDLIMGFRNPYHEKKDSMTLQKTIDAVRVFADDVLATVNGGRRCRTAPIG